MNEQAATTFGAALKSERERMGLTQTELATRISTSQQNIAGWEKGRALPRQELFEKLVAHFGKDSPLAALPPRGTLPSLWRHATITTTDFSDEELPSFSGRQAEPESAPAASRVRFSRPRPPEDTPVAQWLLPRTGHNERLRSALPEHLQANVEVEVAPRYRADYWSEKLGLELKVTAETLLLRVARDGMQHLLALRAKAERAGAKPPAHLVVTIVVPQFTGAAARQLPRAVEEADLLGVELLMCSGVEEAAAAIVGYETGQLPMPEDEDWGAF